MMRLNHLPNQRPKEQVALFLRGHWFIILKIVLVFAMLLGIPLVIVFLLWDRLSPLLAHPVTGPLLTIFASAYLLGLWVATFQQFVDYYLDTWIVTNERVISIEQNGLFHRIASELHLASVQDVTSEVKGVLQSFLAFGNVYVQTAGEKERFEFDDVADPEGVKQKILKLVEEDKRRHPAH